MNNLTEYRLAALRGLMKSKGWDAAIVPSSDPHGSEYLPERWKQREFISGFTGDYGTIVVTPGHAGLWTDTRFFIQFDKELGDTEFVLHKLRVPDAVNYPEWMAETLSQNAVVGIDGSCMSVAEVEYLQQTLAPLKARIVSQPDYLDELWEDRPGTPSDPVFVLDTQYTGRSTEDKIAWLRGILAGKDCDAILLNNLDEIAWLLNLRSNDVAFNPVIISYLLVEKDAIVLFANPDKFSPQVLPKGVRVMPYGDVFGYVGQLPADRRLLIDDSVMNYALYGIACERLGNNVVCAPSPVKLEKALKNATELAGYRIAYLKDGIAQTKYFKWLEEMLQSGAQLSEMEAADKLVEFRREQGHYIEESFAPISATGENAALPHYQPTHENCSIIQTKGLYLLDSGAHYLEGTTDITRTVPAGPLTDLEKEDYTLVLKGMIGLSTAIFPRGTRGANIDVLARIPLWKALRNFGHGTGHGVGHVLCVHEGPQDLRQNVYDQAMLPGMVTSDEPGLYREGMHGVRHENVILCRELEKNEFGDWLGFETLTCTYIDPTPLVPELLTDEEKAWINNYNRAVYTRLIPWLDEDEKQWLKSKTIDVEFPLTPVDPDEWEDE